MSRKFRFTGECFEALKALYAQLSGKSKGHILIEDPNPKKKSAPVEQKAEPAPEKEPVQEEKKEPVNPLEVTEGKTLTVTRTNIGKVRTSNQDAVIDSWPLLGVADGMGGHQGGEVASSSTRDLLVQQLKGKTPEATMLRNAITAVNRRLFIHQQEDKDLSGMGTTLTVMWVGKEKIYIGHVGDSRAYRFRDGELTQITSDHSMVAEMVREGVLTLEQAACHPMRNVITRAVGTEEGIDADILTEERKRGDVWLICSDGLHGMAGDAKMAEILRVNPPEAAADLLVEAAMDAGGRDNISLTLFVDGEDPE
jgi:PPM family protein phosphatase